MTEYLERNQMQAPRPTELIDENTRQLVLDYQEVFGTDAGKRVLNDLDSRMNGRIIPQGMPDCTAFEVGKRDAYLYIIDKVLADPNMEMPEEAETEMLFMENPDE